MNLFLSLGLPIEAYATEKRSVIRFEGLTVYDYKNRQNYYFYGENWVARRQLFMEQFAHLNPQLKGTEEVTLSKTSWARAKNGKLKKAGA